MTAIRCTVAALKSQTRETSLEAEVHVQLASITQRSTRDGKPYLQVQAADVTDAFTLRVWSDHPQFEELCGMTGVFVAVTGEFSHVPSFGLEAKKWDCRPLDEAERAIVLAGGEEVVKRQEQCWQTIERCVLDLKDPRLAAVSALFLEEFGPRFRRSAAARTFHHARRGGLVEHVSQMMLVAEMLCGVYPQLNKDLLVTGSLFHDAGKLWENHVPENALTIEYDERGELLGHIAIGIELVNTLWRKAAAAAAPDWERLTPGTEQVRLHLLHIVAAHHGQLDFGSPVVPKTPEAIALHYIDNLDAKLEMFSAAYKTGTRMTETIVDRVKPLPGNIVHALARFE